MHDKTNPIIDHNLIHLLRREFDAIFSNNRTGQPLPWRAAELLGLLDRWDLAPTVRSDKGFIAPFHADGKTPIFLRDAVDLIVQRFEERVCVHGSAMSLRGHDDVAASCAAFHEVDAYFAGTSVILRRQRTLGLELPDMTALMIAPRRIWDVLAQDAPMRSALGHHAEVVLREAPPKEYDPMMSIYVKLLGCAK